MILEDKIRILEFYKNISESYYQGVSLDTIETMIIEDGEAYIKNKQSFTKDLYDYSLAKVAFDFFKAKIDFLEESNKQIDTFYDKCLDTKEEYQQVIDSGVCIENLEDLFNYDASLFFKDNESEDDIQQSSIKSKYDYKIKKMAIELLKKENN